LKQKQLTVCFLIIICTVVLLGCITGISDITKLLTLGTLPFLSGDLIKITAAAAIARSFTTRK
jgi:biotin transporter BioY